MSRQISILLLATCLTAAVLGGCRSAPPPARPRVAENAPADVAVPPDTASTPEPVRPAEPPPPVAPVSPPPEAMPPCVPSPPVHHVHRRKKSETPQGPEVPAQTPAPKKDALVDAQVGQMGATLVSILGKDVKSPSGEDMGRVVDVLADSDGHVRVAIIDFGGFLGVGNRRIAVDWPLLHFDPAAGDKWLVLSVTRQKLQSTPEYKDPTSPRVLMPPPGAPDAADTGPAKK